MNPSQLNSNDDLYRYLVSLGNELIQKGASEIPDKLMAASQFAFGSPSEFLHEAMSALTLVDTNCQDILTQPQLAELESVIGEIKKAFDRIGGA